MRKWADPLVAAFLNDTTLPPPSEYSTLSPSFRDTLARIRKKRAALKISDGAEWRKYDCDACGRTLNGEHEWKAHLASRSHRKRLSRKRTFDEYKRRKAEEVPGNVSASDDGEP